MRGYRFSLRWLFAVVSFLAIGCGLLVYSTPLFSKLAFTATLATLFTGLFAAAYRTGDRRAFWAGFAAFGSAYVWLICGTWQSPDGSTSLRERLVTTDLLNRCHDALPRRQNAVTMTTAAVTPAPMTFTGSVYFDPNGNQVQSFIPGGSSIPYPLTTTSTIVTTTVDRTDFVTTGHSLFAIVFALAGGAVVRQIQRRRHEIHPA